MAKAHKKASHQAHHPKNDSEPEFVYDPEKDKHNHSKSEDVLASELDPLNQENQILDPKLERRAKRRKRTKRFVLFTLLFLLIAGGAAFAYIATRASKISTNPFNFSTRLKGEDEGRVNILLLGVRRAGRAPLPRRRPATRP